MNRRHIRIGLCLLPLLAAADDWPTYRHDNRRSAVSPESLRQPLQEDWVYRAPRPPQTAWAGPARWDAFSGNEGLQSMRNFDPVFFVTVQDSQVFFGSSVDHAVHARDVRTGKENWVFFTGGPVRLPPTCANGKVYFGSDDGYAYCVNADKGTLIWKTQPLKETRMIPSNGALISRRPCRTGVLIQGTHAYFGASLLPWQSSFLCAVDAKTGSNQGPGCFKTQASEVTFQGALLASSSTLYVPQGRSAPLRYDLHTGANRGSISGMGGVFCVLTADDQILAGPQNQKSRESLLRIGIGKKNDPGLVTFPRAERVLLAGEQAYIHQRDELVALHVESYRKCLAAKSDPSPSYRWRKKHPVPMGYILAGDHLVVGTENRVTLYRSATGEVTWEADIQGRAYGLAAASGRLFVSTDRGHIYCFGPRG